MIQDQTIYFNTTELQGEDHVNAVTHVAKQDILVLQVFGELKSELTAWNIWEYLIANKRIHKLTPVTSIRRALTSLKDFGVIIKTNNLVIGTLGKPCYTWKLKTNGQTNLFIPTT